MLFCGYWALLFDANRRGNTNCAILLKPKNFFFFVTGKITTVTCVFVNYFIINYLYVSLPCLFLIFYLAKLILYGFPQKSNSIFYLLVPMKCQVQNSIILMIIDALKHNTSGIGIRITHHITIRRGYDKSWIEFQRKDGKPVSAFDFFNLGLHIDWYRTQ